MDKMVGRLVAKLEELGLREDTLILFTGDNGTHPSVTSRFRGADYVGGKGTSTVRGNHVPLIASWPRRVPAGRVNGDLVASVDFLPTLCAAAGVPVPAGLDGVSFLPQLRGDPGTPREAYYVWYARNGGPTATFEYAQGRTHKLYRDGRFFDLGQDPFEERPLPASEATGPAAATRARLQAELDRYAQARPAHVANHRVSAASKGGEGAGGGKQGGKK
jgi:arylsulfatase A